MDFKSRDKVTCRLSDALNDVEIEIVDIVRDLGTPMRDIGEHSNNEYLLRHVQKFLVALQEYRKECAVLDGYAAIVPMVDDAAEHGTYWGRP